MPKGPSQYLDSSGRILSEHTAARGPPNMTAAGHNTGGTKASTEQTGACIHQWSLTVGGWGLAKWSQGYSDSWNRTHPSLLSLNCLFMIAMNLIGSRVTTIAELHLRGKLKGRQYMRSREVQRSSVRKLSVLQLAGWSPDLAAFYLRH